jgi:hypothetical protein
VTTFQASDVSGDLPPAPGEPAAAAFAQPPAPPGAAIDQPPGAAAIDQPPPPPAPLAYEPPSAPPPWPDAAGRPLLHSAPALQARSDLAGPAIGLLTTAGINLALALLAMCSCFGVFLVGTRDQPGGPRADDWVALAVFLAIFLAGVITALVILHGAFQMKNANSYGWALTSAIIALIPLHPCFVLTFPFGLWGLIVLARPEIRDSFT